MNTAERLQAFPQDSLQSEDSHQEAKYPCFHYTSFYLPLSVYTFFYLFIYIVLSKMQMSNLALLCVYRPVLVQHLLLRHYIKENACV